VDNLLEKKIMQRIGSEGPITFERFMEMCLYDPELGYYCSGALAIGKSGDFYTSPHLHPVFGSMLGKQISEMWEFMGRPEVFTVLEVGGGEGHICRDMLSHLSGSDFYRCLRYIIVEINPAMEVRQRELLSDFAEKVQWVRGMSDAGPASGTVRGCIFSNELLDAFPVHLVEMQDELREVHVKVEGGQLGFDSLPLSRPDIGEYFSDFGVSLGRGYRTEVNLRIRDWLKEAGRILREGFVLTIDYGYTSRDYFSEDRDRGTLLCYYHHQANEDPLKHIGLQDITCHVNFSALKKWGDPLGLTTIGLASQGSFLIAAGIDEEIRKLSESPGDYQFELARIKKLILPQGMGESHMVMAQYKGEGSPVLRGFSMRNQMRYL